MGEPKGRSSFCPSFPSRPTRFERHKGVMRQMASGTGGWYGHSGTRGSKALQLFTTRVHGTAGGRQHRDMFRNLERQICYSSASSQHFVCVFFVHEACVWFRAVSWFRVSCRRGVRGPSLHCFRRKKTPFMGCQVRKGGSCFESVPIYKAIITRQKGGPSQKHGREQTDSGQRQIETKTSLESHTLSSRPVLNI